MNLNAQAAVQSGPSSDEIMKFVEDCKVKAKNLTAALLVANGDDEMFAGAYVDVSWDTQYNNSSTKNEIFHVGYWLSKPGVSFPTHLYKSFKVTTKDNLHVPSPTLSEKGCRIISVEVAAE